MPSIQGSEKVPVMPLDFMTKIDRYYAIKMPCEPCRSTVDVLVSPPKRGKRDVICQRCGQFIRTITKKELKQFKSFYMEEKDMGLTVKEPEGGSGGDRTPIPEGLHKAICYAIYDLGTQINEWQGQTKQQHQVMFCWEFPDIRIDYEKDGKQLNGPRVLSRKFTLSLHEKAALRKMLQSWRGKSFTRDELAGFDIKNVLGVGAQLQIIHSTPKDVTYANIENVLPPAANYGKPENPLTFFSFEDGGDIPDECPEWIADIIMNSKEWDEVPADVDVDTPKDDEEDLPF